MNKSFVAVSIVFLTALSLFFLQESVFATVGGPTYLSRIALNASTHTLYYLESDKGGMGCPPIIHSVDLASAHDTVVKTCEEVFDQFFKEYRAENESRYEQFITDYYQDLVDLGSVGLKQNHIEVGVAFVSEHQEGGEVYWREFDAVVTQDGKPLATIRFRGCTEDQPHLFEGYRIPDTPTMAMLISNKGDCFEGGYVNESLHLINGVTYYDTRIIRGIKGDSAAEPNTGNLVAFAGATPPVPPDNQVINLALMLTLFVAGAVFGYLRRKNVTAPREPAT